MSASFILAMLENGSTYRPFQYVQPFSITHGKPTMTAPSMKMKYSVDRRDLLGRGQLKSLQHLRQYCMKVSVKVNLQLQKLLMISMTFLGLIRSVNTKSNSARQSWQSSVSLQVAQPSSSMQSVWFSKRRAVTSALSNL